MASTTSPERRIAVPTLVRVAFLSLALAAPSLAEPLIHPGVPAGIDREARYLVYLHGRILEGNVPEPTHPEHGTYDYGGILRAFAGAGYTVIAEHRAADTDPDAYARKVVTQVEALLAAGVPATQVAVVGFSKGGGIAVRASALLADARVRFVFLAACGDGSRSETYPDVRGRFLSVIEKSDTSGRSCRPLFEHATKPIVSEEIEISTGAGHGAFYRPRLEWVAPVLAWLNKP